MSKYVSKNKIKIKKTRKNFKEKKTLLNSIHSSDNDNSYFNKIHDMVENVQYLCVYS